LAAEGARVALIDLNADGLRETEAAIREGGAEAQAFPANVTDSQQVVAIVRGAVERFGRLDSVFNAVGISGRRFGDGPIDQCTEEGWDRVLDVNLRSMFLVCKQTVPELLKTRGAIVNLSSVLGLVGGDEDFSTHAYAASKGAIISMSRAMARYYAPQGLRVNVVAPGLIATAMSRRAQLDPHIVARLGQLQPLTGAFGAAEDVAAAVAYLASDDARFVTGAVLTVDGGWTTQ
jgi:NAD(P)-dependent dehydrogenase (short-subunit alcohol dehydrogenase family)